MQACNEGTAGMQSGYSRHAVRAQQACNEGTTGMQSGNSRHAMRVQ